MSRRAWQYEVERAHSVQQKGQQERAVLWVEKELIRLRAEIIRLNARLVNGHTGDAVRLGKGEGNR